MNAFLLFLAQGFGSGRIRVAPGTWGTVVGVGWFMLLVASGSAWLFGIGTAGGMIASVWICGRAEQILQRRDPGSVVWDELCVMPLALVPVVVMHWRATGEFPSLALFKSWPHWGWIAAGFVLFRVFDIAKPWIIGRSQSLPGGWGVTADDVLAAAATALVLGAAMWFI